MTAVVRRRRRPEVYFSTIGGLVYAWDICSECAKHVSICEHPVPYEPRWMTAERTKADPPITTDDPRTAAA